MARQNHFFDCGKAERDGLARAKYNIFCLFNERRDQSVCASCPLEKSIFRCRRRRLYRSHHTHTHTWQRANNTKYPKWFLFDAQQSQATHSECDGDRNNGGNAATAAPIERLENASTIFWPLFVTFVSFTCQCEAFYVCEFSNLTQNLQDGSRTGSGSSGNGSVTLVIAFECRLTTHNACTFCVSRTRYIVDSPCSRGTSFHRVRATHVKWNEAAQKQSPESGCGSQARGKARHSALTISGTPTNQHFSISLSSRFLLYYETTTRPIGRFGE